MYTLHGHIHLAETTHDHNNYDCVWLLVYIACTLACPLPVDPLPVDPLPVDPLPVDPLPVDLYTTLCCLSSSSGVLPCDHNTICGDHFGKMRLFGVARYCIAQYKLIKIFFLPDHPLATSLLRSPQPSPHGTHNNNQLCFFTSVVQGRGMGCDLNHLDTRVYVIPSLSLLGQLKRCL